MASTSRTARIRLCGATRSATQAMSSSASTSPRGTTKRDRNLAVGGVRAGDDGGVGHRRVARQERLQLGGRDLVGADLDELLEPVDDEHVAVLVHVAEVAGVQPFVGVEDLGGGIGTAQVAGHHLRTLAHSSPGSPAPRSRPLRGSTARSPVLGMTRPTEPGTVPDRRSGMVTPMVRLGQPPALAEVVTPAADGP